MAWHQAYIDYFNKGKHENRKFWSRLGGKPELAHATVLDVGCGLGSLCIDIALSGAKKVVGLDTDSISIEFANENLRTNYPELTDTVEFKDVDLRDYHNDISFDYMVSKDTFEHIIELEEMLRGMTKRLKQGGKIYLGFGPLYYGPFGHHGRINPKIPWGHLIIPEQVIIKRLNRNRENKIVSIQDLGLNKWSLSDYKRLLKNSELSVVFFKVNRGRNIVLKLFNLISMVPFLEEHFCHNLYCILEKKNRGH